MAMNKRFNQLNSQIEIIDEQSRERTRTRDHANELIVLEEAFKNDAAMTLGGSSHINSPKDDVDLIKERDFNVRISYNKKKKGKVSIHNLPSILQTSRTNNYRNSSLQSYVQKGSMDMSYQQKTERTRMPSKMDIIGLETEICKLIQNSDLGGSVQAFKKAEQHNFENLFEQKMLNIQMKIKSQFDSTAHRLRTQQILKEARRRKEQETKMSMAGSQELPADVYERQIQEQKQNILRMIAKNNSNLTDTNYDPQLQMFPTKSYNSIKHKMSGDSSGLIQEVSDESHLQSISHVKESQKSITDETKGANSYGLFAQISQHDSKKNYYIGGSIIAQSAEYQPVYMTVQEKRKKDNDPLSPYGIAMQLPPPPRQRKGAHERMLRMKYPLNQIRSRSKNIDDNLTLSSRSNHKHRNHKFESLPAQNKREHTEY